MRLIRELLRRIDAQMTLWCSGNPYTWTWWQHARSPIPYIVLAVFLLLMHLAD